MQRRLGARIPDHKNKASSELTPLSWEGYFEEQLDLKIDDDTFHIYRSGNRGVVCFLLHGGGFSGLSWALLTKQLMTKVHVRCVAMDMRAHGNTYTNNDQELSAQFLADDVVRVVRHLYGSESPPIVLIGHSMGGAIAVRVAHQQQLPSLVGLVVIDVVEGTALEALSSMQTFLLHRPSFFTSLPAAIKYCQKSGQIRNLESARVSVVGQLKEISSNLTTTSSTHVNTSFDDVIREEDNEMEDASAAEDFKLSKEGSKHSYTWRVDLGRTEPFWRGWFEGLSSMFLDCKPPKLLMLAGVDRMDKNLTIGQMQGKFQLELLPLCGHAVHEDCPEKVAEKLASFLLRFKLTDSKGTV